MGAQYRSFTDSQVLCLETTAPRGQISGEGAEITASVFPENENVLLGHVNQHLPPGVELNDTSEELKPVHDDTVAIWITRPQNDTIFLVGPVVLAFETRGFPPGELPIEVCTNT